MDNWIIDTTVRDIFLANESDSGKSEMKIQQLAEEFIPFKLTQEYPPILYHYTAMTSLQYIMKDGLFWVTNATYMNDSSEGSYFWTVVDKAADFFINVEPENEERKDFIKDLINDWQPMIKNNKYLNHRFLLSFCIEPDSLSMWNYYGKNDGYCMGLSANIIIENINKLKASIESGIEDAEGAYVIYDENEQIQIILNYLKYGFYWYLTNRNELDWKQRGNDEIYNIVLLKIITEFAPLVPFFKHSAFKDEREFRLLFQVDLNNDEIVKHRIYQGIMAPYIEFDFKKEGEIPLESIIISPLIKHELAIDGLRDWLKTRKLTKPVEDISLTRSTIPLRF